MTHRFANSFVAAALLLAAMLAVLHGINRPFAIKEKVK